MRKKATLFVVAVFAGMTAASFADLQDVKTGGSLRIRGNWYSEADLDFDNDDGPDTLFVEQRTTINVSATFTDDVNAFVEFDSYDVYGDSFRGLDQGLEVYGTPVRGLSGSGSALTGFDGSSGSGTPVTFYQGYIELKNVWGTPINVRLGRQEFKLGNEFLVGNNDTSSSFRGLSFDGISTNSKFGDFRFQTWTFELVRNNNPARLESAGDIWFHGYYATYEGFEDMTLEGYLMHYRASLTDPLEAEGFVEATDFYTAGLRFSGSKAKFDWDVEGAYQLGDSGLPDIDDVSSSDINTFALTGKAGYTFDVKMQPRVFVNGAYFNGDEEEPAFNRMFSDHEYSEFLDATDMSNVWFFGGGVAAQITEKIAMSAVGNYFQAVEDFGADDNNVGIEAAIYASYQYSDELSFNAGYAHFFAGDGVEDGQFITSSGFTSVGGFGEADDLDYAFIETSIRF